VGLAMKRDLDHLEAAMRHDIELLRAEFAVLRADFRAGLNPT
jgi:hypothetical protein